MGEVKYRPPFVTTRGSQEMSRVTSWVKDDVNNTGTWVTLPLPTGNTNIASMPLRQTTCPLRIDVTGSLLAATTNPAIQSGIVGITYTDSTGYQYNMALASKAATACSFSFSTHFVPTKPVEEVFIQLNLSSAGTGTQTLRCYFNVEELDYYMPNNMVPATLLRLDNFSNNATLSITMCSTYEVIPDLDLCREIQAMDTSTLSPVGLTLASQAVARLPSLMPLNEYNHMPAQMIDSLSDPHALQALAASPFKKAWKHARSGLKWLWNKARSDPDVRSKAREWTSSVNPLLGEAVDFGMRLGGFAADGEMGYAAQDPLPIERNMKIVEVTADVKEQITVPIAGGKLIVYPGDATPAAHITQFGLEVLIPELDGILTWHAGYQIYGPHVAFAASPEDVMNCSEEKESDPKSIQDLTFCVPCLHKSFTFSTSGGISLTLDSDPAGLPVPHRSLKNRIYVNLPEDIEGVPEGLKFYDGRRLVVIRSGDVAYASSWDAEMDLTDQLDATRPVGSTLSIQQVTAYFRNIVSALTVRDKLRIPKGAFDVGHGVVAMGNESKEASGCLIVSSDNGLSGYLDNSVIEYMPVGNTGVHLSTNASCEMGNLAGLITNLGPVKRYISVLPLRPSIRTIIGDSWFAAYAVAVMGYPPILPITGVVTVRDGVVYWASPALIADKALYAKRKNTSLIILDSRAGISNIKGYGMYEMKEVGATVYTIPSPVAYIGTAMFVRNSTDKETIFEEFSSLMDKYSGSAWERANIKLLAKASFDRSDAILEKIRTVMDTAPKKAAAKEYDEAKAVNLAPTEYDLTAQEIINMNDQVLPGAHPEMMKSAQIAQIRLKLEQLATLASSMDPGDKVRGSSKIRKGYKTLQMLTESVNTPKLRKKKNKARKALAIDPTNIFIE
jgi:hypothetical protein